MNVHVLRLEPDCLMWVWHVNMTETRSFVYLSHCQAQLKTPTHLLHISPLSFILCLCVGMSKLKCNI